MEEIAVVQTNDDVDDFLKGMAGADRIQGLGGTDMLLARAGADIVEGGAGSVGMNGGRRRNRRVSSTDSYAVNDANERRAA